MKSLIPLFPFVAALGLIACQGDDGPVAEGAVAGNEVEALAVGQAAPIGAAAAEAADRAAQPPSTDGMAWTGSATAASYGPSGAQPVLSFECRDGALVVTRFHPATPGATGTLSFTGGGAASSLPMRAVARPGGPGESHWQSEARGDMARAVARAFARPGQVEVTLGSAPALAVPGSPLLKSVFERCAS